MTNEEFLIEAIVKAGCEEYGGSSECSGDCFRYCKSCTTSIDVKSLARNLIEDGVLRIPCKVGDEVFLVLKGIKRIKHGYVQRLSFNRKGELIICIRYMGEGRIYYTTGNFKLSSIGETVFFVKDEAKKKLNC